MKIVFAEEFYKKFQKLPSEIQKIYQRQEQLFRQNWRDSRLHIKKLDGHPLPFSFRITRRYRVLFTFVGAETVLFATIGHRKDTYEK